MNTSLAENALFDDLMRELENSALGPALEARDDLAIQSDLDARIWVLDDASVNVKVVERHLTMEGYTNVTGYTDPTECLQQLMEDPPDILLLDIVMPQLSGIEVLQNMRRNPATSRVPVLILSASNDRDTRVEALKLGATDFLAKPVDRVELIARLRNVLSLKAHHDRLEEYSEKLEEAVRKRTAELVASRLEVVHCLARASEFRDDMTGRHVLRVGRYASIIGRELGFSPHAAQLLGLAAQLHDVGKIAVPDSILLKDGKLEPEEYRVMQKHCALGKRVFERMDGEQYKDLCQHAELGGELLGAAQSPLIRMASRIALTHHEWWNGEGYPLGLSGNDIPLEGRITAVADVFDALSSRRPYKPAYPVSQCFEIMQENRGTQFDPEVLDAFIRRRSEVISVQLELADVEDL